MREEYDFKKLKIKRQGIEIGIGRKEGRGNLFANLPKHMLPEEITETLFV